MKPWSERNLQPENMCPNFASKMDTDLALAAGPENFGNWPMEDVAVNNADTSFMTSVVDG